MSTGEIGTGDSSVDAMLDVGMLGLSYFERYAPLFEEWTGGRLPGGLTAAELAELYDQQRGLDLGQLESARQQLARQLGVAVDAVAEQGDGAAALPQVWRGAAADRASAVLGAHLDRSRRDLLAMGYVQTALATAVEVIEQAVRAKADYAAGLDPAGAVGDAGPRQIEAMIQLARTGCRHPIFPMFAMTAGDAAEWLDTVFVPEIISRVTGFVEQCAETAASVDAAFDAVVAAMNAVDDSAYPAPSYPAPSYPAQSDESVGLIPQEPAAAAAEAGSLRLDAAPELPASATTTRTAEASHAPAAEPPAGEVSGTGGSAVSCGPRASDAGTEGKAAAIVESSDPSGIVDIGRVLSALGGAAEVVAGAVADVVEQAAPVVGSAVADAVRQVGELFEVQAPESGGTPDPTPADPSECPGPMGDIDASDSPPEPPGPVPADPPPDSKPLDREPTPPEPAVPEPAGPEPEVSESVAPEPAVPAANGATLDVGAELAEAGPL